MSKEARDIQNELLKQLLPDVFHWRSREVPNPDWSSFKAKIGSTNYGCDLTFKENWVVVTVHENPDGVVCHSVDNFVFTLDDPSEFKAAQQRIKQVLKDRLMTSVHNHRKQIKKLKKLEQNLAKFEQQLLQLSETETLQPQEDKT